MTYFQLNRVIPSSSCQPSPCEPQDSLNAYESARALRMDLADAVACLPEPQQFILALYYREGLRMREIGVVLGITESRISQLHAKALIGLRAAMIS